MLIYTATAIRLHGVVLNELSTETTLPYIYQSPLQVSVRVRYVLSSIVVLLGAVFNVNRELINASDIFRYLLSSLSNI
jgi:hypothetical protein